MVQLRFASRFVIVTLVAALAHTACASAASATSAPERALATAQPAPGDTAGELAALERDAEREIALAARGADPAAALAAVEKLSALAHRLDAEPRDAALAVAALGALARGAGALAMLGSESAAPLRDGALDAIVKHHADGAALLPFLERFGRGNALAIGVQASERFLEHLAREAQDPAVRGACSAARALALFEAIDSLGPARVAEMRAALARVSVDQPGTRWARRADAALFHWEHLRMGRIAPELTGVDDAGRTVKLSALRGRVVVLDFWRADDAAWRAQLETQRGWVKSYAGRPLTVLGVNADDDPDERTRWKADELALLERRGRPDDAELVSLPENERAFFARVRAADVARVHTSAQKLGLTWPSIVDGEHAGVWTQRWNVVQWPTVVLIDAHGRIRFRNLPPDELVLSLAMLVQEAEAAAHGEKR